MAKKTKKQKQRTATRRPTGAGAPAQPTPRGVDRPISTSVAQTARPEIEEDAPVATPASATGAASRRRVERVDATVPRAQPARGRQTRSRFAGTSAALVAPMDSDDPAIPFDRVPYVPADLRRVAVIAVIMIVIIIVAGLIASQLVK